MIYFKNNYPAVAILGFAQNHSQPCHIQLARSAGKEICNRGLITVAGNTQGTPGAAIQSALAEGGDTLAVLTEEQLSPEQDYQGYYHLQNNSHLKHHCIARICRAAIAIGGGPGSWDIVNCFASLNKPVVLLQGSGGICGEHPELKAATSVKQALSLIL